MTIYEIRAAGKGIGREAFKMFVRQISFDGLKGCWEWQGYRNPHGYGMFKSIATHRLMWILLNGLIPYKGVICHKCDNPPCINPAHIYLGTHQDNMRDIVIRGRHNKHNRTLEERLAKHEEHVRRRMMEKAEKVKKKVSRKRVKVKHKSKRKPQKVKKYLKYLYARRNKRFTIPMWDSIVREEGRRRVVVKLGTYRSEDEAEEAGRNFVKMVNKQRWSNYI